MAPAPKNPKSNEEHPKSGEYEEGRFWFERKANLVTLGLTASGAEEVGVIQSIEFPDEGDDVEPGDVVCTIEGAKGSIELTAPATGFVQEFNTALNDEPDLVIEDPTDAGWLVTLQIEDPAELAQVATDSESEDEDEDEGDKDEWDEEDDDDEDEDDGDDETDDEDADDAEEDAEDEEDSDDDSEEDQGAGDEDDEGGSSSRKRRR